jgi:anti-sigma factor RsiW
MSEQLHLTDDDLVLHYYGEEVPRAESHLAACEACQANFTRLQRVMAFIDSAPAVEAPEGFERIAWARLQPALGAPRRGWFSWFVLSPARLAFAAGVLLLVGAAFMAGWRMPRPVPADLPQTQTAAQVRARQRDAIPIRSSKSTVGS